MAGPSAAYPIGRYDPSPLVDLGRKQERERLSASAIKAFLALVTRWRLSDEDARALLGGMSNAAWQELRKRPERVLDADRLLRVSLLIGVFKALHILHGAPLADAWVRLPNSNRLFGGQTPLGCMLAGGIPAMQMVRRLLDARRGGA
jgi:hypothetical protein